MIFSIKNNKVLIEKKLEIIKTSIYKLSINFKQRQKIIKEQLKSKEAYL